MLTRDCLMSYNNTIKDYSPLYKLAYPKQLSYTQAKLIDNQITDSLANKASMRAVSNLYTKPMLYSTLGLGLGGGLALGDSARATLLGKSGLLPSIAKAINPESYNLVQATAAAKGMAGSSGLLSNMMSAYMPIKAVTSAPGYALAKGLTALGGKAGVGSALGSALTGAGSIIGGGAMAPIIGSMATLYALKKGTQMLARSRAAKDSLRRISMLQAGYAPATSRGLYNGYTDSLVRDLGLKYIK